MQEISRRKPALKNRVSPEIEAATLELATRAIDVEPLRCSFPAPICSSNDPRAPLAPTSATVGTA